MRKKSAKAGSVSLSNTHVQRYNKRSTYKISCTVEIRQVRQTNRPTAALYHEVYGNTVTL